VEKYEQNRGTSSARGYTREWAIYSRAWLARHPICGMRQDGGLHIEHSHCARLGLRTKATCTDHIRAIKAGGARFDPANHQSLCHACNSRKAIDLEHGFGR